MRGGRGNHNRNNNHSNNHNQHHNNSHNNSSNLTKLFIKNWVGSSSSSHNDGGISALVSWLERTSHKKIIKNYTTHSNPGTLVIQVHPNDANDFLRLHNSRWSNVNLTIEGPRNSNLNNNQSNNSNNNQNQNQQNNFQNNKGQHNHNNQNNDNKINTDEGPDKVEQALIAIIKRSYHPGEKHLNLSNLPQQAEIIEIGLHAQPASKVFSAIFVCCETKVFETPLKRQQMVESLSLEHNGLTTVKDCIAAAGTFNAIKNLSLAHNNISDVGELRYWRNRFPNLEHLILQGNPKLDTPETLQKMRTWYPKLKMYNGISIPELEKNIQPTVPKAATATLEILPNAPHPDIEPGSDYGQPAPNKPADIVMKEQMALRFSYETRLKLEHTTELLVMCAFDYQKSLETLDLYMRTNQVGKDHFLWQPPAGPS